MMRRERRENEHEGTERVLPRLLPYLALDRQEVVGVLHKRRERRVEPERLQILGDFLDQPGSTAVELLGVGLCSRGHAPGCERVRPSQKAYNTLNAARVPWPALCPRTDEHQIAAQNIGAVTVHELLRVHHVAAALAHLLRVLAEYDALVKQPRHRLVEPDHPEIAHYLREETGVEQVHRRVLDPPGVLVNREPALSLLGVERPIVVVWREVAVLIPRGVHERVHRVRLPLGRTTATGTRGVAEALIELQRRLAGGHELRVLGQKDGQLLLRDGHYAAMLAVDDRYRGPPVALALDQPVPQAIRHCRLP